MHKPVTGLFAVGALRRKIGPLGNPHYGIFLRICFAKPFVSRANSGTARWQVFGRYLPLWPVRQRLEQRLALMRCSGFDVVWPLKAGAAMQG